MAGFTLFPTIFMMYKIALRQVEMIYFYIIKFAIPYPSNSL